MRILNPCVVLQDSISQTFDSSKIRSCKPGWAPAGPATHFQCSTALIRQDISATSFCSCKLLGCSDDALLPCLNEQPDIFAVMNCCVVALIVFSSDTLAGSADSSYWEKAYAREGFGVKPSPLSLIFYENFITCAKGIVFGILFAC